jgi:pimeloyl-ACP methyl ester carboxylesterase
VAAVVYDRRGGSSDLDLKAEADDVLALVGELRRRPEIDATRVGVVGLSRGGWVASWAAAVSPTVKFLVLECAPAVSVTEQELQRIRGSEPTDSLNATDVQQAEAFGRQVMRTALGALPWTALEPAIEQARAAHWRDLVQIPETPKDLDWWRRNEYDQASVLSRVHVPVLAMFGEADRMVPPGENADPMRRALAKGGNSQVTIEIVPRAPHGMYLFGHLVGGRWDWPAGYWAWAAKAPGVFERVGDWVLAR